jgi:hypothetical protein
VGTKYHVAYQISMDRFNIEKKCYNTKYIDGKKIFLSAGKVFFIGREIS